MVERARVDPQSRLALDAQLEAMPGGLNAIRDILARREAMSSMLVLMTADLPANPNIASEDREIPGPEDGATVTVRTYRPVKVTGSLPGLLYIHGGGMVLGDLDGEDLLAAMLCELTSSVVVAVDYRLAPEHPAPAPAEDCYAALQWMGAHASELGFDAKRLAVYGGSAGGGLAIAVALMARDRGGPGIRAVMAPYPMLDDRNATPSSHEITDLGVWDRAANIEAWAWYLGGRSADAYAAPARAEDLAGLPPMFIDVGELDLFRDEDIAFAARLLQAGVPTELHVHPGAYHASEVMAPQAELSQRIWATRIAALQRALAEN